MPNTKSNAHAPPLFSSSGTYSRYSQRREMYLRPDWQSVMVSQYIISTTTSTLSSNVSHASLLCLGFDKMFKEYIFHSGRPVSKWCFNKFNNLVASFICPNTSTQVCHSQLQATSIHWCSEQDGNDDEERIICGDHVCQLWSTYVWAVCALINWLIAAYGTVPCV